MKTLKFKDSGVLWRLATTYGPSADWALRGGTDICTYTRSVLIGIFMVLVVIAGGSLAGAIVIDTLMFWAFRLMTVGPMEMGILAFLGTCLFMFATVWVVATLIFDTVRGGVRRIRNMAPAEPGPVRQMYRAWKDKYCARVIFGDDSAS